MILVNEQLGTIVSGGATVSADSTTANIGSVASYQTGATGHSVKVSVAASDLLLVARNVSSGVDNVELMGFLEIFQVESGTQLTPTVLAKYTMRFDARSFRDGTTRLLQGGVFTGWATSVDNTKTYDYGARISIETPTTPTNITGTADQIWLQELSPEAAPPTPSFLLSQDQFRVSSQVTTSSSSFVDTPLTKAIPVSADNSKVTVTFTAHCKYALSNAGSEQDYSSQADFQLKIDSVNSGALGSIAIPVPSCELRSDSTGHLTAPLTVSFNYLHAHGQVEGDTLTYTLQYRKQAGDGVIGFESGSMLFNEYS